MLPPLLALNTWEVGRNVADGGVAEEGVANGRVVDGVADESVAEGNKGSIGLGADGGGIGKYGRDW
jgi:hypothetical protein